MEIEEKINKSRFSFLLIVTFILLIFLIGNQFRQKLQTSAIMEYNIFDFKSYIYKDFKYELPKDWVSEISSLDYHYKNVFKDINNNLVGSIEVLEDNNNLNEIIERESVGFIQSNIMINGINYILLENKVLSDDGVLTRNFNYYAIKDYNMVKVCFSSNDKKIKENISVLFEDILDRINFL